MISRRSFVKCLLLCVVLAWISYTVADLLLISNRVRLKPVKITTDISNIVSHIQEDIFDMITTTTTTESKTVATTTTNIATTTKDAGDNEWEEEQIRRQQLIRKMCHKYKLDDREIGKGNFIYDPSHKLLYCRHGKVN